MFFLTASCDFKDTNLNPILPTDADLKEILPTAITQTARNLMSIGGRVTGTVVQHFKGIDAQPESYSQYLIDERTLDEFWRTGLYAGAMKDCRLMMEKAAADGQHHYNGIAKILMAVNLGIATCFWGDVPYSEAFGGLENLQPKYDTQEEIYQSIQRLLNEAIEDLQKPHSDNPPTADDLIFNGNPDKWTATAKALQARYFLHLSKHRPDAAQMTLDVIHDGAFQDTAGQPFFLFGENVNEANPLPLFGFERPDQLAMSDFLFQKMTTTNDPRLPRYAVDIGGVPFIFKKDSTQLFWGQFDAPLPLISLTELRFIEAEALLRLGHTSEAEMVFQKAVMSNFEQLNIPFSEYQAFINEHIYFNNSPGFEQQLHLLISQKHVALFGQNPIEAWVDYRRTGCPTIAPPPNANASLNPSMMIPKRYLYPISERTSNEENRNEAIQRQGGHLLDVDTWAFE